jgi:hypothetical protein
MCGMRAATFAARKDLPEMERATTRAAHFLKHNAALDVLGVGPSPWREVPASHDMWYAAHFLKHTAALDVLGVGPSPWREVPASHDMWQERDREAKMGWARDVEREWENYAAERNAERHEDTIMEREREGGREREGEREEGREGEGQEQGEGQSVC